MQLLLLVIPSLAVVSAVLIYRHNGKKEVLKFDLVQFVYAFVLSPALFVWLKSFLFYLVKTDPELNFSSTQMYALDTSFSVLFMFVYAFIVIHSLTKSFNLKRKEDPLYDVFRHSEYFHLWLTHLVMYLGIMLIATVVSFTNLFLPLELETNRLGFYLLLLVGVFGGLGAFSGVWLSDPEEANFLRIMKLASGLVFLLHVIVYFLIEPGFSIKYGFYWLTLMTFATAVFCFFFFHRSEKAKGLLEKFKHHKWEFKADIFKKK
ncbi:MAG: hypothetical protein GF390_02710 [Candidatus Pacebacteria bacterium]|nr:hypothetical protein [Candidatus Paceibacterota bacterium]